MKWDRIAASWRRLKDKLDLSPFRSSDDDRERSDLIGAGLSRVGQSDALQPAAFHPDDRGKRSEFSLHIGC